MGETEDRRAIDRALEDHIRKSNICMEKNREEIEKISNALFGDQGIVDWAKEHIESEKERKELYKDLKKTLIVRGVWSLILAVIGLLFYGIMSYIKTGGTPT